MVKRVEDLHDYYPHDCLGKDEQCKICCFKRPNTWLHMYLFGKSFISIKLLFLKKFQIHISAFHITIIVISNKVKEFANIKN